MQPSEDEFRAFVGPNADYYLRAWEKVDPNGKIQRLTWNWPAFFLNITWPLYRYFWIGFGVIAGILLVKRAAEELLHFNTPAYMEFFIRFSVACYFGSLGNWFYYRHAAQAIARTKAHHVSPEAIGRAGGVRPLLPVLVLGLAVVLGILAAILFPDIAK